MAHPTTRADVEALPTGPFEPRHHNPLGLSPTLGAAWPNMAFAEESVRVTYQLLRTVYLLVAEIGIVGRLEPIDEPHATIIELG